MTIMKKIERALEEKAKMHKVEICQGRDCREFEILSREELEEKIANISATEVYEKALEEAEKWSCSGHASCYIDARNGELGTIFLQNGTYEHPFDSFYEITLCAIHKEEGSMLDDPKLLLDDDEWEEYRESDLGPSDFVTEKHGQKELEDRKVAALQWLSCDFECDFEIEDDVNRQLDELYREPVSELPFFEV
jgi:hypothetical protein